jgi:excisionase family DNA binding protein
MGSKAEDTLTISQAARLLGVSARSVRSLCKEGRIQPEHTPGKVRGSIRFRKADLLALVETNWKKLDFPKVAKMSAQALAEIKTLRKRVDQLSALLGVDQEELSLEEDDLATLYATAQDTVANDISHSHQKVMWWARRMYSMTEEYLHLMEKAVEDPEPWRPFLTLVQTLCVNSPREEFPGDKKLEAAYAYLNVARKHLRQVSYFYVRTFNGEHLAARMFPKKEFDEEIVTLLMPH